MGLQFVILRHGAWESVNDDTGERLARCSVCHYTERVFSKAHVSKLWSYCPVCGAMMDLKEENDDETIC